MIMNSSNLRDKIGVYLVTAEPATESTIEMIMAAVSGGIRVVQLRDKSAATADRIALLRRLQDQLDPEVILLANDDVAAAAAVPGVGVHVGPDDQHPAEVRRRLGDDVCIGWSIHHLQQLQDSAALAAADYVAASPVWPTPTKTDTTAPFGIDGVRRLREALAAEIPLVGIGGINVANATSVIDAGADGVAVVSAICAAADPARAAADLLSAVAMATAARS
ncbi:MAG TPA: thiamine phosphate synthase [Microlunatus sp.]